MSIYDYDYNELKDKPVSINKAFSEINRLLGTKFISNTYGLQIIIDLFELIKLNSLKIYHEKAAWFDENNEKLSNVLSSYYIGVDSEWEQILMALPQQA